MPAQAAAIRSGTRRSGGVNSTASLPTATEPPQPANIDPPPHHAPLPQRARARSTENKRGSLSHSSFDIGYLDVMGGGFIACGRSQRRHLIAAHPPPRIERRAEFGLCSSLRRRMTAPSTRTGCVGVVASKPDSLTHRAQARHDVQGHSHRGISQGLSMSYACSSVWPRSIPWCGPSHRYQRHIGFCRNLST